LQWRQVGKDPVVKITTQNLWYRKQWHNDNDKAIIGTVQYVTRIFNVRSKTDRQLNLVYCTISKTKS